MIKKIKIDSSNPVMMAKCLPNGEAIYMSKALVDYFGFDEDDLNEQNLFSLIHHDDQEDVLKRIAELDKHEQTINTIHRTLLMNKKTRKNRWLISLDKGRAREHIYQVIITDIDDNSEQQRSSSDKYNPAEVAPEEDIEITYDRKLKLRLQAAEKQLHYQELLLHQIAKSAPVAFIIYDDRTQDILYFSDYFCEIWNVESLKDKLRMGLFKYRELMEICLTIVNNKSTFINNFIAPVNQDKGSIIEEVEFQDGRIIRGYSTIIAEEEQGYIGRICVFEDITERRRIIDELIQNQKLESMGALTGGMVTDFEKIFEILSGHFAKIKQNADNSNRVISEVGKSEDVLKRAETLVKQMHIFAQRSKPRLERVAVPQIIIELVSLLREIFLRKISVVLELESNLPKIKADKVQLHQALLNICLNARDAMPSGGKITITARMTRGTQIKSKFKNAKFSQYVSIDITDNGTGIDKKTVKRIFEPFFTTKGSEKGTGLGLTVVESIISAHQGFIDAESVLGKGTSFHIYLPILDKELAHSEVIDEDKGFERDGETILLIEDETDLLECLKELFEMEGYKTLLATNGHSALEQYKDNKDKISLVFSDKGIPGIDGEIVMQRIRKINPQQKYILASGFIEMQKITEDVYDENLAYLQKPYKMDIIIKKVRDLLDK